MKFTFPKIIINNTNGNVQFYGLIGAFILTAILTVALIGFTFFKVSPNSLQLNLSTKGLSRPSNHSTNPSATSNSSLPSGTPNTTTAPSVNPTASSTTKTGVNGLLAVKESKDRKKGNTTFEAQTYKNPNISGVALRIGWNEIEPQQNQFDWSLLDDLFSNAKANNKTVTLIIMPGFTTPSWALKGVETDQFCVKYGGDNVGAKQTLPMPWDQVYLQNWFNFLSQVKARYGNNSAFKMIAAAGPTSVSAEMSLPNQQTSSCPDLQTWQKHNYTPEKYISAWRSVFSHYATLFPNQAISLALYPGLPLPDDTQKAATRQAVINEGLKYPNQFSLQTSGLNASKQDDDPSGGYDIVRSYNGQIATGFQMSTSATKNPDKMGDVNNPANALKLSLEKGLVVNSSGKKIKYLQIYEPDILNPSMQSVLAWAKSQF